MTERTRNTIAVTPVIAPTPATGTGTGTVTGPRHREMLDVAERFAGGDLSWRARKIGEAHRLVALAERCPAGRFEIVGMDLRVDLRVMIRLDVPVPLAPGEDGAVVTHRGATVGIAYPHLLTQQPVPGPAVALLLEPASGCHHPNVAPMPGQPMCFGPVIPANTPLCEIVLWSYGLLSMQAVMLDPGDPAGVLNLEAAHYWQEHQDALPLTRTPMLAPDPGVAPVPAVAPVAGGGS